MSHDARCIAPHIEAPQADSLRGAGTRGWRLFGTAALLLITLPVFAIAALACLPVMLVYVVARGAMKAVDLLRTTTSRPPTPARAR